MDSLILSIAAAHLFTLSKSFVSVPVSLRLPIKKALSALIGQISQAWAGTVQCVSALVLWFLVVLFVFVFYNCGCAGGIAKGGGFIVMRSQP